MIAVSLRSSLIINRSQHSGQHVMSEAPRIVSSRLFASQVATQGLHSLRRRPLLFCSFCGFGFFFTTDFDKRCRHMCAACVPRPDQGGLWKKHFSASSKSDGSLSLSLLSAQDDITAHYWHLQQQSNIFAV